jgi:DNA sulfur modification protein DndD
MIFRRLVLEDFGLYRGIQEIGLAPRRRGARSGPVVLFGGKNGAGKSTIFEAILLCLYGKGALGERTRQADYLEYLFQRMHRSSFGLSSTRASVTVEFDFVQSGTRKVYEVTRSWIAEKGTAASIEVSLDLKQDGQRLDDLEQEHWDDFLRELIPPGLSQLFFFDGERIQRLAEEQDSAELGRSVKALLSLDLVERLSSDLQTYLTRQVKASAGDQQRKMIEEAESLREQLEKRLSDLRAQRTNVQQVKVDHSIAVIANLENKLRSEGSELAKARDDLEVEQKQLLSSIRQAEERLRELASGPLVFALCPKALEGVRKAIAESAEQLSPVAKRRIADSAKAVLKDFAEGALEGSEAVDRRTRKKAAEILGRAFLGVFKQANKGTAVGTIGNLSVGDRSQILGWIDAATTHSIPEAKRLGDELERTTRRLQKIQGALAQAPSDDVLKVAMAELTDAHRHLGAAQQEALQLDEQIQRSERDLADVLRGLTALTDKVEEGQKREDRITTVKQAQLALKEYLVAVTEVKLAQLEREVTQCFGAICRKGDLVEQIRINAESFDIALLDKRGNHIPKERLSAGEKQVFAIALLWALGRTSGRPLPVIIDTPLARLDSDHRKMLIERYLPAASHQVLVLSTDTEVDEQLFAALEPYVSHAYQLVYDPSDRFTTAEAGYFWSRNGQSQNTASPVLHRG